ncbi:hypothetical protein ruthe_00442, partial [Rubellimicrobium thermophilum DSM 16684]
MSGIAKRVGRHAAALAVALTGFGLAGLAAGGPASAEGFTFRRVGVPAPGSTNRITVQIDPIGRPSAALPPPPA